MKLDALPGSGSIWAGCGESQHFSQPSYQPAIVLAYHASNPGEGLPRPLDHWAKGLPYRLLAYHPPVVVHRPDRAQWLALVRVL